MTQTATKTVQSIATVTLKATGLTYILYPMSSRTSDTTYAVWTINNKPVHCTCKARKFNSHKMCPHMKQWLAENSPKVEAPVCSELKTSFATVEEEFQYKLGAYGKKVAYGWLYEQKQHSTVEVVPTGQAEEVATVASHETEGQLPQETRQKLYNWKQSESGDAMEREYNAAQETADSNLRAYYNGL